MSILGTGDFARAFSKKLATHGYSVLCGTRFSESRANVFKERCPDFDSLDVTITSIAECFRTSDIIVLALHSENISAILRENSKLINDKILVDVSNPTAYVSKEKSNVEILAEEFPKAKFVKALNSLSAYELENGEIVGDRVVFIAGDDKSANSRVEAMARSLGYPVVMAGDLNASRRLEEMQTSVFHAWGKPILLTGGVFVAWGVYGTLRYQMWKGNPWSMLPVNTMNKVYGCSALTLLSLCYLPGCVAAGLQLWRGTKHRAFPGWLDQWLKMRKELGLIALTLASTHCILSVAHLSPAYFTNWYVTKITAPVVDGGVTMPTSVRMNLQGEMVILLGSLALGTMSILGVTSIPSVMSQLNWKQWDFLHSGLGYMCLRLASAHVLMKGGPDWPGKSFPEIAKGTSILMYII